MNVLLKRSGWNGAAVAATTIMLLAGCGSSKDKVVLHPVSGQVTLDGRPLPFADVEFQPEKGSASYARTDAEGRFSLLYSGSRRGATEGTHVVRIRTYATQELETPRGPQLSPELVPIKFNQRSELKVDVKSALPDVKFDLSSKAGPIVQPARS